MNQMTRALEEVRDLYQKVTGTAPPEIQPFSYVSFPPGVDPVDHAIEEVRRLRQISEQFKFAPRPGAWIPPADTYVGDDAFVIRLELCGVPRDELKVYIAGGECIVRGERNLPAGGVEIPVSIERGWGPFERRFPLPAGRHTDHVAAKYVDGVLEVRIELDEPTGSKETTVDVA